jgi:endonuclease/exonuclease/phosphatase family metal-dependent hydrolase
VILTVVLLILGLLLASRNSAFFHQIGETPVAMDSGGGRTPWTSASACETALQSKKNSAKKSRAKENRVRIGTWNLHWFPDGSSDKPNREGGTDIRWMGCVIALMDLQVVAVQEVKQHFRGRQALEELLDRLNEFTGGDWHAEVDDCPGDGRQQVGLLFDKKRVKAEALRSLPSLNPAGSGCAHRLRPGYAAYLRFSGGADLHLVTLHLDSGVESRDFENRRSSWASLMSVIQDLKSVAPDDDAIVLGDFNTMGCSKCAQNVSAAEEIANLENAFSAAHVGMRRLKPNLDCSEDYRGHGNTLDHIFVSSKMKELPTNAKAEVKGLCEETSCWRSKGSSKAALSRLSDHCPLVVELVDKDLD